MLPWTAEQQFSGTCCLTTYAANKPNLKTFPLDNKMPGAGNEYSLKYSTKVCIFLFLLPFPFSSDFSNPNEHHRQDSVLPVSKERNRFRSITWENYDPLHQKYLEIGEKITNVAY